MRTRIQWQAAILLPWLILAAGGSAAGMDRFPQKGPAERPPQNEVSVILKLVQVFVTDGSGRPVTDLRISEFELLDNGVPQPISAFENHSPTVRGAPESRATAPSTGPAAVPTPASPGRKFLLLFDFFMNDPGGIRRAKDAAVHFIDSRLLPGDEIGVMSLSIDKGFFIHQNLTADRPAAKAAVQGMRDLTKLKDYEEVYVLHRVDPNAETVDEKEAENEYMTREAGRYCDELRELARALGRIDGFKTVLLFSRGLSRDVMFGGEFDDPGNRTGTIVFEKYQSMLQELSRASSPVFTVNTEGSRGLLRPNSRDMTRGTDALVALAEASGGTYFPTADHAAPLADKINESTANYYVLGYRIGLSWDGRYHELKVRVKRPGCDVRAQAGYYDPKQYADFSPFEKRILLADLVQGQSSPFLVPIDVPLATLPLTGAGLDSACDCLILTELAPAEIRDLARRGAEIFLFIGDENRQTAWSQRAEVDYGALTAGEAIPYALVSLPPGRYEATIAVRNMESGMTALGKSSFLLPVPTETGAGLKEEAGFRLDPPLLLRRGKDALYLKATEGDEEPGLESIRAIFPFVTTTRIPALGTLEAGSGSLEAVVRVISPAGPSPQELDWTVRLIDSATGEAFTAAASSVISQVSGSALAFLLEIDKPALPPGDYSLEILAVDSTSGREARVSTPVRVKPPADPAP